MNNKRIMIISSDNTGLGHKSVSKAISESLAEENNDFEIKIINGFLLADKLGKFVESLYIPILKYAPFLWKVFFEFTSKYTHIQNSQTSYKIEKNFLKEVNDFKPDLIISVHPGFVGSVLDIMNNNGIDTPFITVICDIFKISNLWVDNRALYSVCPNPHIRETLLCKGIDKDSTVISGFPLRTQFVENLIQNRHLSNIENDTLKILVVATSENFRKTNIILTKLIDNFNCTITVIAGNNTPLKRSLENKKRNGLYKNVDIYGYVDNIANFMLKSDILITKGGPNTIMEGINCNIPMVLIGSVPGQEEGNNEFIAQHNLGVICKKSSSLVPLINDLLNNDKRKLKEIKQNQLKYQDLTSVKKITELISNLI